MPDSGSSRSGTNSEITLTLRGPRVSIGLAPAKQTTLILRRMETLLRRRVEDFLRNKRVPGGGLEWPAGNAKLFDVFMRPVEAEEFAVAFRLGLYEQLPLFSAISVGDTIIGDFMRDARSVIDDDSSARVDSAWFRAAVQKLEPDGKEVTSIEITAVVSGELISVRIPPRIGPAREVSHPDREKLSIG